jgi:GH15 family glucan-1,4-alpha-glucosidase
MRIEDYALIGDCQTAALVSRDGSIDWLCWPRFDSGACFAALLGTPENGRWRLASLARPLCTERRYRSGTLVLESRIETQTGAVDVVDFMPVRNSVSNLMRMVIGRSGRVRMHSELVLRFDYGSSVPWVTRLPGGEGIQAVAGPDKVVFRSTVPFRGKDLRTVAEFDVDEGETAVFELSHTASNVELPAPRDPLAALHETELYWRSWSERCRACGRWTDPVQRSLITLKALTYQPTGGLVAAATTSLPEQLGGERNWDYRYCWLRDATITLLAFMNAGYLEEADAWRQWLLRAVAGSPSQMQIMYGIAGEKRLPEMILDWLPGYEGAAPVRIGNAAASQLQLDVYGELMDAMYQARKSGLRSDAAAWALQRALVTHLEKVWTEPDESLWEVRGGRRHFTFSKVMAWVALDRAIRSVEEYRLAGPIERWKAARQAIHDDVCRNGVDAARGCFVQSYGSTELDASLLLVPLTGFLPPEDPRIAATVAAIQQDLMHDGFVLRYRSHESLDGLPPGEGAFIACNFWLADNLVLLGRHAEATALFERLLALGNDVGLLAEEYDPRAGRQVGNFPQAFSHLALVNTAFNLFNASNPAAQRAGRAPAAHAAPAAQDRKPVEPLGS